MDDELYELIGGYLELDKKLFITDLLSKNSIFKGFIHINEERFRDPQIEKFPNKVVINYDNATDIDLDKDYKDYFKNLKYKYKGLLKGRIIIRTTCYATFLTIIDFNLEEEKASIF